MSTSRMWTGGRALAEMVARHNPGPVFGMGGFQLLPFYDGMRQLGLRHILVNDERAGCFAADAFARVTGRPGMCDATLGPGATNLVTGLAESYNAGVPLVVFVGDTHRSHSWKHMTQETRQQEILSPVCKEYLRIEDIARIPELVRRAFHVATTGRHGPVVLAVPEDVAHGEYDFTDLIDDTHRTARYPAMRARPDADAVSRAASLLAGAQRPVILAGGGVHLSGAQAALAQLAETLDAPVAHSLSGKSSLACTDPRSVGLFGRYSRYANELIEQSDALLVVGCKLGEIATKRYSLLPSDVPIVQIDVVAEEIGRSTPVAVALWADARLGMEDLAGALADEAVADHSAWWAEVERRRTEWAVEARSNYDPDEQPINLRRLVSALDAVLPEDAIVVADGGFASHWTGLLWNSPRAGRHFVADRGFASIGYGVPGGFGAALGADGAPVVALTGDGGFNMSCGELETVRRAGVPLVVIVVNNAASGYVKALQHAVYGEGAYQSSELSEMDYAALAQAMGCRGIRVTDPALLEDALREALAEPQLPVVLDVVVTRDPARMLPGIDSRAMTIKPGDRPA